MNYRTSVSEVWACDPGPGSASVNWSGERALENQYGAEEVFRLWGKGLDGRPEFKREELVELRHLIDLMLEVGAAKPPSIHIARAK